MTKKDVYVVVDTPKKANKLKKLLEMFNEPVLYHPDHERSLHNGTDYGWGYGFCDGQWQGFNTKSALHNGKKFKKVSIKELKQILAKEHLKEGDWIIAKCSEDSYEYLVKIDRIEYNRIIGYYSIMSEMEKLSDYIGVFCFIHFKRYATPEEIALLEPKKVDKFAELKEAHKNGAVIECLQADGFWLEIEDPQWQEDCEYRIKPEEIKDSDIATIEALHDVLLDNHKYDFNSKLLKNARELCKKLHNIVGG